MEVTLGRTGIVAGLASNPRYSNWRRLQVAQAFDVEAAKLSTLYRCPDQLGERKARESVKMV